MDEHSKDIPIDTPLLFAPGKSLIRLEPLGVVLVMGSWNYPMVVTLKPLAQAIASGNCVCVKPSERSPASSEATKKLVDRYLDPDCFSCIEGGVEIAIAIT